jgi:hypothetical protein
LGFDLASIELGDSRFPANLKVVDIGLEEMVDWPKLLPLLPPGVEELSIKSEQLKLPSPKMEDWVALSALTKLKSLSLSFGSTFDAASAQLIPG